MGLNPKKHRIIKPDHERMHLDLKRIRSLENEFAPCSSTSGCIGVLAGFEAMSTEAMSTDARALYVSGRPVWSGTRVYAVRFVTDSVGESFKGTPAFKSPSR